MKMILVVLLSLGASLNSFAQSTSLETCDLLYSHRGADLFRAVDCYRSLVSGTTVEGRKEVFERAFIALSAVVNDSPKTQSEIDAIAKGLSLVDEFGKGFSNTADFFYWRAVFTSFDAMQRDRGSVLPRHLFAVLKSLQEDLRQAMNLEPSVHLYGPARVLGIMHTQMPGIVGGDKILAEKLLTDSYQKAPGLCSNHLAYARILQVNGKEEKAKEVLEKFLALGDEALNPYPGSPLRALKNEVARDRKSARDLLTEMNGD